MCCSPNFDLFYTVGYKIKRLEKWFLGLQKRLLAEMKAKKDVTTETLLESLTILPTELQMEYRDFLEEKLPTLEQVGSVSKIFSRVSLHFTFIDYGLLQHLSDEFGSEDLKQEMVAFVEAMQVFLDETTVQQLMDHWPGRNDIPPNFKELRAVIDEDPSTYSLRKLDDLRRRFCSESKLSRIIFVLVSVKKGNSFIMVLMVPSILVPWVMESVSGVGDSFYQSEHITSVSVSQKQLYLSVTMREKKVRYAFNDLYLYTTVCR